MITQIGIVTGTIWEFLEKREVVKLSEIMTSLNFSRDTILMGLGWLIREGYVVVKGDLNNDNAYIRCTREMMSAV